MSNDNTSVKSGGTNILGLLGVAFVVLKLTGFIGWSWWLVLLPFCGGLALILAIFLVVLGVVGIGKAIQSLSD